MAIMLSVDLRVGGVHHLSPRVLALDVEQVARLEHQAQTVTAVVAPHERGPLVDVLRVVQQEPPM